MDVGVDAAGRRDQPVAGDRPRAGSDREVHAVGDVGVARPADAGDAAVLDPQVGLQHAEPRIHDHRARDHRVELALAGGAVLLGHARAQVLGVAPQRLVGGFGEVALDADPQVGVAQADLVAGGGAVASGVLVTGRSTAAPQASPVGSPAPP